MKRIYLDNSATTALCAPAIEAMQEAMQNFGNPSSLHAAGQSAAALLRECRRTVGEALGERFLKDGQLIFTSCGTEATALAILGAATAKAHRAARTVLTTDSEHPSVENNLRAIEAMGYRVVRVPTRGGELDMEMVHAHMNSDLFMVSMMLVNNETGARYPLERVFAAAHAANPRCICHCDAVQGFMKMRLSARTLGADLITLSAHKIHGPKGVGALYIDQKLLTARAIAPVLLGGGQEFGFRSGTENVIGIAGFAAAVRHAAEGLATALPHMTALREALIARATEMGLVCNLPPVAAPHIVSITVPYIKSETVLHFLDSEGISVSSGSACSSHAGHKSAALHGFGLDDLAADCTLRVSLSPENTMEDMNALCAALEKGMEKLVHINHAERRKK